MGPRTLLELLQARATHRREAAAITAPGRRPLSYVDLLALIERTGAALSAFGIRRDDRVAIVLPNGPEMATLFLAVAAACGAAPLNPGYVAAEFEFYLTDLGAKALLVEERSRSVAIEVARAHRIPILEVAGDAEKAGGFHLRDVGVGGGQPAPARPEDVALVLHTSGTTSRPKIVPLSHRNLCASAVNIAASLSLGVDDRCLNVMPLFHIHGLMAGVLASLAAGAGVCCTPGFRAADFHRWLDEEDPTWFTAVPTIHQAILQSSREQAGPRPGRRLRFVRSCSAPLPPRVMRDVEDLFGVPVIEAYGMTEAAHQIASNPLPPGRRLAGSVGLPAGVEIAIVDETGVPVPAGGQGEIVIQGPGVLARYEADAATNAASFVNGYLRTGDLGRFDPDGYLFLTGRIKELINRGGEKIAPAEVDAVLLEHAAVRQAVAFGVPHPTLGEDVAAAIVPRAGALVTETELREFVATRLSAFKVPRRVHVVDEIPKGPTGKLNRRMLAEHFAGEAASRAVEPRTPTEELLVRIWAEILNVQTVGIRDNYCALGGDSLRATAIAARAQEAGLPMEPQMLFEHPTIEELAGILARA